MSNLRRLIDAIHGCRRAVVILLHLGLVALSNYLAFLLRFEGEIPYPQAPLFGQMLPWLLVIRGLVFIPFRLHEGLWRYTSIWDLRNIIAGVVSSSVVFYLFTHYVLGATAYSRSIFIVDSVLLICFMSGVRLTRRMYRDLWRVERERRVLIYGAGDAAEMIVRGMKNTDRYEYEPVGFVDDDRSKVGQRIHGVPVLGTREDLAHILRDKQPHEILIAIPRAEAGTIRGIVNALEPFKIKITTLPNLRDMLDGRVTVSHIRNLTTEDLLARAPVGLDPAPIRGLIEGRRVMVTGAGGSIGSELCRQIAELEPENLVLYERYENSLFAIANELTDRRPGNGVVSAIGDVTDQARLDAVLRAEQPEIIFHAAAHKHVPLMEQNPCEAVKNNVIGTRLVAEAAERHGVDRFILISTDKAVNPTSVMGATKRVAELLVQAQTAWNGTSFFTVRFGNVLASNGSVVPRFLDQIRAGGPVTVTHPEMRRYFMLIREAVQLVLHAAAQGETGEIYVLEMGEQVKLVDMARNLIRLAGFVPDEDIPISFIGVRAGEKLFEELVGRDEVTVPSGMDNVVRVHRRHVPATDVLAREVAHLERLALDGQTNQVLAQLQAMVPEFRSEMQATVSDRPSVVRVPVAEPALPRPEWAGHTCPACRSVDVHRSYAHSVLERVRRSMSARQPFRCHACGWRGWLAPVETVTPDARGVAPAAPDLARLDAALTRYPPPVRPAFSPRQLR